MAISAVLMRRLNESLSSKRRNSFCRGARAHPLVTAHVEGFPIHSFAARVGIFPLPFLFLSLCDLPERIIRWNVISGCCRLRTMFKRLMILGIAGLTFVLGANYLLVYTLNQRVARERERQDRTYWSAFNAVERFGEHADQVTEQKAKAALDEARQKGLSKIRARILQTYFEDLEHCYQGDRESCKKANTDMNEAIRVPAERK